MPTAAIQINTLPLPIKLVTFNQDLEQLAGISDAKIEGLITMQP